MDTDLRNNDPVYPNLMTNLAGQAVDYSNGGYVQEVRPEYGGPGIFEINHWYDGATPQGPLVAAADRGVHWRIPIATDVAMSGARVTVRLPRGTGFSFSSGYSISKWGGVYGGYTWAPQPVTAVPSADGLTWVVTIGALPAKTGVVIRFDGIVPAGTVLSGYSVATAHLDAAYAPGSVRPCPAATPSTSGNMTQGCALSWQTDATLLVSDGTQPVPDVTRGQVVQPSLGDPGKFGIDGWSNPLSTGTVGLYGRFVLATDYPVSNAVWTLHLNPNIVAPSFTVVNPAPGWRVDNKYPSAAQIDSGSWDPASHTMTYHLTMPAKSSVVVAYAGVAAPGSYLSGTTYMNTSTVTGTYAPGSGSCSAAPTQRTSATGTQAFPPPRPGPDPVVGTAVLPSPGATALTTAAPAPTTAGLPIVDAGYQVPAAGSSDGSGSLPLEIAGASLVLIGLGSAVIFSRRRSRADAAATQVQTPSSPSSK